MYQLPQETALFQGENADHVYCVPPQGRCAQGRLGRQVRYLPQRGEMESREIQSRQGHQIPVVGQTRHNQVRCLPQTGIKGRREETGHDLHRLPQEG